MNRTLRKVDKREIFISDIHFKFEDELALEIAIDIVREVKPDLIWLGGDIIDFYSISYWLTDPTQTNIREEIQGVVGFLDLLRRICPKAQIVYQHGNHEERWRAEIWKHSHKLSPLLVDKLSLETLLELNKFKVKYVEGLQKVGKLWHFHGDEVRKRGQLVHIALTLLKELQRNFICGHYHVFQNFPQQDIEKEMKAGYVNGCLFDPNRMPRPHYTLDKVQRGISIVEYYGDLFHVTQVPFVNIPEGMMVKWNGSLAIYTK